MLNAANRQNAHLHRSSDGRDRIRTATGRPLQHPFRKSPRRYHIPEEKPDCIRAVWHDAPYKRDTYRDIKYFFKVEALKKLPALYICLLFILLLPFDAYAVTKEISVVLTTDLTGVVSGRG
jgi:hypothetical protein